MHPWVGRAPGEGIGYPLQCSWASLVAQLVKNPTFMQGNLGSIPRLGRSPGEENSYPLQSSGLENSMDCIVHGGPKNWTRLSDFHSLHFTWLQQGRSEGRVPGTRQEMARLGMKRSVSSRESFGFCPQDSEVPASISVQEQQGQTCILGRASGLPVM